jgi:hypothetical protein
VSLIPGTIARRAKARLTDFAINEVSLVDAAANLRKFVLTKRNDGMATEKMTLKLPTAAKQGIMDGLAQCLDKATALSTMVGDAEVDDAATVPQELSAALSQVGEMFEGMAQQYGGAPPEADTGPDQAPPPDGGAPPPAPQGKNLPTELHDGDNMKPLREGDSLKTLYHKTIAAAHDEVAAVEKAGRKMAGARYKKLSELHDNLGKLLNELAYDEASEAQAGKGAQKNAPAPVAPVAKTEAPPPDGGAPPPATPAPATPPAVTNEAFNELVATTKGIAETLTKKVGELDARVNVISKSTGTSNALQPEGGGAPPAEPVKWAADMSAEVRKKKIEKAAKR